MTPAIPEPTIIDSNSVPVLRWGIAGAGRIVENFVHAAQVQTRQRVEAIAGRSPARVASFAASHGIELVHADVNQLVEDPHLDAIYVGTPHTSHMEISLAAIAAGKHVLIEKPIATSAAEAETIANAARAAGVFVMEAMWTRYLPQWQIVRTLLADGVIGDVNMAIADFGFISPFNPDDRIWNPADGGGALLDAGVYPLSFASSVLGAPSKVVASGVMSQTGVDERAVVQLTTESGASAIIATSIVSSLPSRATVMGTKGRIDMHRPFFVPTGVTLTLGSVGSETTAEWTDARFAVPHDGMSDEINAFAQYIGEDRVESPVHTLDETVSILATIDEARAQVAS